MLWEIWGRRKLNFAFHGLGLVVGALSVWGLQHSESEIVRALLRILLLTLFIGTCLDLLMCFAYITADAHKVQVGYPGGLFLKPVRTVRLALVPMIFGGVALVATLAVWKWILTPVLPSLGLSPLWLGAVLLSFFWWMQTLGWSLPYFPGRSMVLLMSAVMHLLVALMPLASSPILLALRLPILAFMLVAPTFTAVNGLKWMRFGRWEGASGWFPAVKRIAPAFVRTPSQKFGSAFQAQFWLEWQRQGRVLPGMCSAIVVTVLPLVCLILKSSIKPGGENDFVATAEVMVVLIPLVISGAMGPAMARFDPVRPAGDLPVYIAVRPMTNGGFVIIKLAVALVSSALTWVLMAVIGVVTMLILQRGLRFPSDLPYGFVGILAGCIPLFLLLTILTWNNLVSGMASGLTGRQWVIGLFTFCKGLGGAGLFGIVIAAKYDQEFKDALVRCLLSLLCLGFIVKIAFSIASFRWGLRRNAITTGAVGWIVGGWLFCGAFIAGYVGLVCHALHKPDYWIYATLSGFLLLPLADLAIAPMAMAWNRHR
jgi:hypothetical protein